MFVVLLAVNLLEKAHYRYLEMYEIKSAPSGDVWRNFSNVEQCIEILTLCYLFFQLL